MPEVVDVHSVSYKLSYMVFVHETEVLVLQLCSLHSCHNPSRPWPTCTAYLHYNNRVYVDVHTWSQQKYQKTLAAEMYVHVQATANVLTTVVLALP